MRYFIVLEANGIFFVKNEHSPVVTQKNRTYTNISAQIWVVTVRQN